MKIFNYELNRQTQGFTDILDITDEVRSFLAKSKISEGLVTVFVPGSTGGITTIEYEPGLLQDIPEFFDQIIPQNSTYQHDKTWGDGNGFSHVRAALLGPSLSVPVFDGAMKTGTWQQIIFIDFDNRPRNRTITVQIIGE